jgi:hypothetical protein
MKSMAATQKLIRAASPDDADARFSAALENVSLPSDTTAEFKNTLGLMNAHAALAQVNPEDARMKAYKGLEALVFQNLFETTLPHDSSLGTGMAGDVWRSMMADQMGKQAAKMIDLGLFPKTEIAHPSHASASLQKNIAMPALPASDTETTESSS